MIKKLFIIFIFLTCFIGTVAKGGSNYYARVIKVLDGDSFVLDASGGNVEIRLYGVDSPEYNQPFAKEAKKFTREWLGKQRIMVQPLYVDSYGRSVAIVVQEGQVLNSDLVEAGLAWVYPRYCRQDVCQSWKAMERVARTGKFGLWHDMQPIAPWQWRRLERGN